METNEKEMTKQATPKKVIEKDKIIVGSIVGGVIVIALIIFGVFLYNTTFRTVATFDGGSVTAAEYEIYYKVFAPMLTSWGYPDEMLQDEILNKAAIDKVVLMLAANEGITLTEEDKQAVEDIFSDSAQTQQFIDSGLDPVKMKELYLNDYTIAAYLDHMTSIVTTEEVRANILANDPEADLREFTTRHILITTVDDYGADLSEEDKADAKVRAEAALARIKAGEDFATVATEVSEDPGSATEGGLYTMFADGTTVEAYEEAVKNLAVGSYTPELVETEYGYHIILLESVDAEGRLNSDMEKDYIVSAKLDAMVEEYNVVIDEKAATDVTNSITGNTESELEVDTY